MTTIASSLWRSRGTCPMKTRLCPIIQTRAPLWHGHFSRPALQSSWVCLSSDHEFDVCGVQTVICWECWITDFSCLHHLSPSTLCLPLAWQIFEGGSGQPLQSCAAHPATPPTPPLISAALGDKATSKKTELLCFHLDNQGYLSLSLALLFFDCSNAP